MVSAAAYPLLVCVRLASMAVLYYLLRENGGNESPSTGPAPGMEG